jgi:cell division transport system permease protein
VKLTIRETLLSFRRAPVLSLLAITTIGFALFVVGLFGLVVINLRAALSQIEERVEVVMYLTRGTPIEAATLAIGDIEAFPEVESVRYVSEDEALERARHELVEFQGAYEDLETNPLPASLEISLKPGFRDTRNAQAVAARLHGFRFAEDIQYGHEWVQRLDRLRNIAGIVMLVIGAGFVAAAVIIIGTTIRMTVLARAREIQIMRLVGATDGFIRRPFLLDGALKGALGGFFAVALNFGAYAALTQLLRAQFFTASQAAVIVGIGIVMGFAASAFSVARHLPQT